MSQPTQKRSDDQGVAAQAGKSAWSALGYTAFRYLWIATVVSNVGAWMYNAAAGWLMTSLNANPLIVSLVQVASSLPLFLFGLPAGRPGGHGGQTPLHPPPRDPDYRLL